MDNARLRSLLENSDEKAFLEIYEEMSVPLFTVILRIVGDRGRAEDVLQETFLRIFKNPPDCSVKNPRAWIYKTARNLSLDTLKKRRESELCTEPEVSQSFEHISELRIDIESALGSIPNDESQIVSLHLSAELTFREISAITGLSVPSVYRKYVKAVNALRKTLNGGIL